MSGEHLVEIDGKIKIQSDKYPGTPPGKVPLSTSDPDARDLLWIYAQRHIERDEDFAQDILTALQNDDYDGPTPTQMFELGDDMSAIAAGLSPSFGGRRAPGWYPAALVQDLIEAAELSGGTHGEIAHGKVDRAVVALRDIITQDTDPR